MSAPADLKATRVAPLQDPEDAGIRAGVRLRDPHALAVAYQAYWPALYRQAKLILPDRMDPEDAASDVFLHVVENAALRPGLFPTRWRASASTRWTAARFVGDRQRLVPRRRVAGRARGDRGERGPGALRRRWEAEPAGARGQTLRHLFLRREPQTLRMERGAVWTAISRGLANLKKGSQGRDLRTWWESTGEKR
jgi:hypothetical protein